MAAEQKNGITEGIIWKQILIFFFPILFGTFFQQLYNAADAVIVGRFVGKEALSAVGGSTGTIIQLLVGFFTGLSGGATVVISQYYGAKSGEMVSRAVHTAIAFCLAGGMLLTVMGFLGAPKVLEWMNTPADVMDSAILYIRIYFLGITGSLIYNIEAGILRAVGDSRKPLYFLIAGCLINIVLDVIFVVVMNMGVGGAALATIISQAISAVFVTFVLMKTKDMYRLELKMIRLDMQMLGRIIQIGFPSGLQSVMYSLSNMIIQTSMNSLGTDTVAAFTAYGKIDSMFWMMQGAFGISITTFTGQNFGAQKMDRVRKGVGQCMVMCTAATIVMSTILYHTGIYCFRLFTGDEAVIGIGMQILKFLVPFYIAYITIEILSGALRGIGDCWVPTLISLLGICVIRVIWNLAVVPMRPNVYTVATSYPMTWIITSTAFAVYYFGFSKIRRLSEK